MFHDRFLVYDFRFLNGTASCHYGKDDSEGNGHRYALFIYDFSILRRQRLSSAPYSARKASFYGSPMVSPLSRLARRIEPDIAIGTLFHL